MNAKPEPTCMKELVKRIVQALVDFPEQVKVTEVEGSNTTIFEVKVSSKDVGKLLGKKGRNIDALRSIVFAASKGKNRYVIDVINEHEPHRLSPRAR
jgi:predicted RNA-binding protein YlqC (UPF0109 family)